MKTITMLFSIMALSLASVVASAKSLDHTYDFYAYEEVPVFDSGSTRTVFEDFKLLYEGTPTYETELVEEAELAAFEEIGEMQE